MAPDAGGRGYAVVDPELEDGVRSVPAPIRNAREEVAPAVLRTGPEVGTALGKRSG